MAKFYELVYGPAEASKWILEKWPQAIIEDASDFLHEERFEVRIEGISKLDFYSFALEKEFLLSCFCFNLALGMTKAELAVKEDWLVTLEELIKKVEEQHAKN